MNEKIEEIIEQCSTDVGSYDPYGENRIIKFDKEKFAELIIKECIKICEHQATMQFDAYHFNLVEHDTSEVADQCAKEIKEYFGVE